MAALNLWINVDVVMCLCCQMLEVDANGAVLRSFGGERGTDRSGQLNWPWYVIVDDQQTDQCLVVADRNNKRVLQLDSQLRPTGVVISSPQGPTRLCLVDRKLLVAHSN